MRNILIRIQLDSRHSYFKSQDKKMVTEIKSDSEETCHSFISWELTGSKLPLWIGYNLSVSRLEAWSAASQLESGEDIRMWSSVRSH